ncbi:MAG TPA: hypothetical protein PLI45_02830 [Candidatus Woesebacteria bacterium]|nr:hypothetical protein [Candidatus Woesebacteria bacterium]
MIGQTIFSLIFLAIAAAVLVWFIVDEVKWHKHKEEIKQIYVKGGAEEIRGCEHVYQIVCFIAFLFVGILIFPW